MKVAILSKYPFPQGMAATNRIKAYACGLNANDVEVCTIIVEPTDSYRHYDDRLQNHGEYKGVKYVYTSGRYKAKRRWARGLSLKSGYRFLYGIYSTWKFIKKEKFDTIIVSNDTPVFLWAYLKLAKFIRAKSLFIFDEYPTPIRHKLKSDIPGYKKFLYRVVLKNFDGYVSISQKLADFYKGYANKPCMLLSIIVNTDVFKEISDVKKRDVITYVGNMELIKDNVDNIITAFSMVAEKYFDYSLNFYGTPNRETREYLSQLIKNFKLSDRVFLKGKVSNEDVPKVLGESKILVSSQPKTKRAEGGFPTKLGEYVAMGVPTIICDVGENSKYLEPCKECIYAKPEDPYDFANKIAFVIDNYELALSIAKNGQKVIIDKYSHVAAGRRLKEFIESL